MLRFLSCFWCLLAFGQMVAQPLQLAPPQATSTRLFAKAGQTLAFDFRLTGAEIRYTTDDSEPTVASLIYTKPLNISGLNTIKARSFKPGFSPSETTTVQLVQPGKVPVDSVAVFPAPKKYLANGWKTLCDGQLGDGNFQQHWLGFEEKAVEVKVFFAKKTKFSQLSIGYLQQQGSWIFGPAQVLIYDEKGRLLASHEVTDAALEQASAPSSISIALPKGKHKALTIKVMALPAIPDWHPGKGGTGWLFLDEVLVW
jgi:Fn3 associated